MIKLKFITLTPAKIVLAGFFGLILVGALLLMLPISSQAGVFTPFLDSFFTSASATCVTGLVRYDTASHWSVFGQSVILLLIQIGGMGVVTAAIALSALSGRRIGLSSRVIMQESISAPKTGGIVRMTRFIVRVTLCFELTGAILLALRFCPQMGVAKGLWYAVFHSISAFCNAGFDLMGVNQPYSSLVHYVGDPLVNLVIAGLIIAGGLGFFIWQDLYAKRLRFSHYHLHTKLVLLVTALLILLPALAFFGGEFGRDAWQGQSTSERVLASVFQSVTARTAGFNTVDLTLLHESSQMLLVILMLIGGSPSSTAGGMKTTTLAVLLLTVHSIFKKQSSIECFRRRVEPEALKRAAAVAVVYLVLFLGVALLVCACDGVTLTQALFESASAIGTVGLSLGITPGLGSVSQVLLIMLMYFGRVGCLTLLFAMATGQRPTPAQMPLEKIIIG